MGAGQEEYSTGGMQDMRDTGKEGCRTGGMKDRMNTGQLGCRIGWMQDRRDPGQERLVVIRVLKKPVLIKGSISS